MKLTRRRDHQLRKAFEEENVKKQTIKRKRTEHKLSISSGKERDEK